MTLRARVPATASAGADAAVPSAVGHGAMIVVEGFPSEEQTIINRRREQAPQAHIASRQHCAVRHLGYRGRRTSA